MNRSGPALVDRRKAARSQSSADAGNGGAPESADAVERGFFERTVVNLRDVWHGIANAIGRDEDAPDLGRLSLKRLREEMAACLDGEGGEVARRARAAALGREYLSFGAEGRAAFLRMLAEEHGPDAAMLDAAAQALLDAGDDEQARHAAARRMERALMSPRRRLLTQFNILPDGVKFLVDMRAEVMQLVHRDESFGAVLDDLTAILRSWFDVGFLELRRITWDSPASLLEKLIAYEAVHEIKNWDDLKNRLDSDRRCFAFFHPRMPDEPLIFVEVALVDGIAGNVQKLLDPSAPLMNPDDADTAIFYSISNAQKGLAGISFGDFLIKRVVGVLSAEFRHLKRFATLSPIPGFCAWLEGQPAEDLLTPSERKALPKRSGGDQHPLALVRNPDWHKNRYLVQALEGPLTRLAARYLLMAKAENGRALDPVAHFHLSNGARVEQMNWLADISSRGLRQSAGMMVNYLYKLDDIDANHEAYKGKHRIAASSALRSLARK